jgi:hypothetical protein
MKPISAIVRSIGQPGQHTTVLINPTFIPSTWPRLEPGAESLCPLLAPNGQLKGTPEWVIQCVGRIEGRPVLGGLQFPKISSVQIRAMRQNQRASFEMMLEILHLLAMFVADMFKSRHRLEVEKSVSPPSAQHSLASGAISSTAARE